MRIRSGYIQDYINGIYENFTKIASEVKKSRENPYEIAGWQKKERRQDDILIYRVTATDKYIDTKTVFDIYSDNSTLFNFSREEIKYISSLAVMLLYKREPKYKVIWENFRDNLHDGIVKIKDRDRPGFIKAKIDEIEKNIALIDEMNSRDAYNIGKEMGVRERMLEEEAIKKDE